MVDINDLGSSYLDKKNPSSEIAGSRGASESPSCLLQWSRQFTNPSAVCEGSLSSACSPAFVISSFLVIAILPCVRHYLLMVLIGSSLIISSTEHLFLYLLPNGAVFGKKGLFRSSTCF